jgi:phosphonate transport system substrate-binding protein
VFRGTRIREAVRHQDKSIALLCILRTRAEFHSVFIVNSSTGLKPIDDVEGLDALQSLRFAFGSESTSGRQMPQHFLDQAGVSQDDFAGAPGYSGSHDKTIDLVESGSFEAAALHLDLDLSTLWAARRSLR